MSIVFVWEYEVKPEFIEVFENVYNSEGDWVRLFENAEGYLGSELLKDAANSFRFMTIDTWDAEKSREEFMKKFSVEYKELDAKCENFTTSEKMIGVFNLL